jgi:phosphomannomutase
MRPSKSAGTALKMGQAFGLQISSSRVAVTSRDDHPATRVLARCLISGLLSVGVEVRDLGVCPAPVTRHAAREFATCAVHVHAGLERGSPFMAEFYAHDGDDVHRAMEQKVQEALTHGQFRVVASDAGITDDSVHAIDSYVNAARGALGLPSSAASSSRPIVVDYAYGMGSLVLPRLLDDSAHVVVALNSCYDDKLARVASSNWCKHIAQFSATVIALGAAFGIYIDPSCETFVLADDRGRTLPSTAILPENLSAPDALFGAAKAARLIAEAESPLSELVDRLAGLGAPIPREFERLRA